MRKLLKRYWRQLLAVLVVLSVAYIVPPLPEAYENLQTNNSLLLTDRSGVHLRRELSVRQGVNVWVPLGEMPPVLVDCVLTAEDKRFYYHPGLDPAAICRATYQNLKTGSVVSGASTVTQQLLRTLDTPQDRSLRTKLKEAYWATRLELSYDKDEILEAYLNRVAFGPSVYGVEEASRYYFDKPASSLSTAEAAALAVTIRSPSVLDPFSYTGSEELGPWTSSLLERVHERGLLTAEELELAKAQELELSPNPPPFLSPHFCDLALQEHQGLRGEVATSLDLDLQTQVEGMVRTHLALLTEHHVTNAAVIVAEVETGEILALAGSAGYERRRDGQHNAAVALRQPGSTIKPFTYAQLMQSTGQAGFILPDLNLYENADIESFVPKNYDRHFHGPVSIRTSLACSYNVPAVRALERVGPKNLLQLLQRLGFVDLDETPEHYGLGLTLGNGSASLWQLVEAYRVLAADGQHSPLTLLRGSQPEQTEQVLDPRLAFMITDILSDRHARIPSFGTPNSLEFPYPVAVKTGTSKGYRDNWCVGYTPTHVVGVWVGNSDGSPMRDVSGITGAGPLFRDVMLALGSGGDFERPEGLRRSTVCALSGESATDTCPTAVTEYVLTESKLANCSVCNEEKGQLVFDLPPLYEAWGEERGLPLKRKTNQNSSPEFRFVFPLSEDIFLLDPDVDPDYQRVKFRIVGGSPPYSWTVDSNPVQDSPEQSLWWKLEPGTHTVEVRDSQKLSRSVSVQVVGKINRP